KRVFRQLVIAAWRGPDSRCDVAESWAFRGALFARQRVVQGRDVPERAGGKVASFVAAHDAADPRIEQGTCTFDEITRKKWRIDRHGYHEIESARSDAPLRTRRQPRCGAGNAVR